MNRHLRLMIMMTIGAWPMTGCGDDSSGGSDAVAKCNDQIAALCDFVARCDDIKTKGSYQSSYNSCLGQTKAQVDCSTVTGVSDQQAVCEAKIKTLTCNDPAPSECKGSFTK